MANMFYRRFKDDTEAKEYLEEFRVANNMPPTQICFSAYQHIYNGDRTSGGDIYMGFFSNQKIRGLIKEINSTFENIKIVLVDNFLVKLYRKRFYIFRVELSARYTQVSNFILTLAMAQFIRIFCFQYTHFDYSKGVKDIAGVLGVFNMRCGTYGVWSGSEKWTLDEFKLLDNIEIINEATVHGGFHYSCMPYVSVLKRNISKVLARNKLNDKI